MSESSNFNVNEGEIKSSSHNYEEKLIKLMSSGKPDEFILKELENYHENDIAGALEKLDKNTRKKLYNILGMQRTSEVFAYLENPGDYINELDLENAADIIELMDADDAVDLLEEVGDEVGEKLISLLNSEAKEDIELINSYDEDEIGSKMTTNFIEIKNTLTIKQAMKELINQAAENDNLSIIYTRDSKGKFAGIINLTDLIIARDYEILGNIIRKSYPSFYATEKVSDCIERLKDYAEDSIPVLSDNGVILGVITAHDIVELIEDEISDDYAKLGGLVAEEDLNEPWSHSIKKRLPWLIALLALGILVSSVVGMFEHVVAQLTIVVFFQSLILDMAGNVGTQSLAVTIRVLADGSVSGKQKLALVLKEMKIGLINGLLLGILSVVFIGLFIMLMKGETAVFAFSVSACVGAALLLAMVISSLVGTITPIFFNKIKIDPAVASGPLITTINDLVAVITYYGLVWLFLINLMKF